MTEETLDEYVGLGLLKASLHGLCRAPGREEVPNPEAYEAVVFRDFFEAGLRFPAKILLVKFCNVSGYKSIS